MAKKQSFGELVDLTQDLSDDEEYRRAQKARPSAANEKAASNVHLKDPTTIANRTPEICRKPLLERANAINSHVDSTAVTEDERLDLSQFKYTPSQRDLLHSETIVRPMNKKHDGLRRFKYDPKTIARDILVSAGKHPNITPLNYHLDPLRKMFRHVNRNSNLSTFRWDLVDPGGPKMHPGGPDVDLNDADDEDTCMNEPLNDERLASRQVQVMSTVDGGEIISGGKLLIYYEALYANGSLLDMSIANPAKELSQRKRRNLLRSSDVNPIPNERLSTPVSLGEEGPMSFDRTPQQSITSTQAKSSPVLNLSHRARGRPPGSANKAKYSSEAREPGDPFTPSGQRKPERTRGSKDTVPRKSSSSEGFKTITPTRTGSANLGQMRTSGLRNALTMRDGVAVVIEPRFPAGGSSKGKKSESKETKVTSQQSAPRYKVYKCLWKDCSYELHNLETLRKHVYKHRQSFSDDLIPCLWEGCGANRSPRQTHNEGNDNDKPARLEFNTETAWEQHMNGRHLEKFAWELGDGPSMHPSGRCPFIFLHSPAIALIPSEKDAEISDCLSDSRGRRITPSPAALVRAPPTHWTYHPATALRASTTKSTGTIPRRRKRRRYSMRCALRNAPRAWVSRGAGRPLSPRG